MPLTLPSYPPVAGTKAKASQVIGWFAAVIAKFAGGITSADAAAAAGFTGSQLSKASGTRITNLNLENGAVDSRVLASDASAGRPLAAVARNNLQDGIGDSALLAADSVIAGKLKTITFKQTGSQLVGTGLTAARFSFDYAPTLAIPNVPAQVLPPNLSTIDPLCIYLSNVSGYPANFRPMVEWQADASGNITFVVWFSVPASGNYTVTFTINFVYVSAS